MPGSASASPCCTSTASLIRKLVAEDTRVEHERLRTAVAEMHGALDNMLRSSGHRRLAASIRDVLETYRMIAEDVGWLRRIGDAINTGLTAEAAVQKVNDDIHARMRQVADDVPARARPRPRGSRQPAAAAPAERRGRGTRRPRRPGLRPGRPQSRPGPAARLRRRAAARRWCWRKVRPTRTWRSSPAPSTSRWSARSATPWRASSPATC